MYNGTLNPNVEVNLNLKFIYYISIKYIHIYNKTLTKL